MFLINKYSPKNIDKVFFHKEIYELLKNMSKDEDIPHIIFHGVSGTGKKTMINIFLEMLFDSSVWNRYNVNYKVSGSSNKVNNELIEKSDYHIIIKPKNTNYDRYLIHNVVQDYAKRTGFNAYKTNRKFKIIQIDKLDNFTYYAQTSLRRTIENYSNKCRFIMWCNSLSNVIRPIQSRCICIKLPAPTESELLNYICHISSLEQKPIKLETVYRIIKNSDNNIKKVLWSLESHWLGINDETDYDKSIKILVKILLNGKISEINMFRDIVFKLYITNFTHNQILSDIVKNIMLSNKLNDICKINIMTKISELEYNMIRGRRAIIHFDSIVVAVMNIISKNS
jgi:replication factor C subunit 3/5